MSQSEPVSAGCECVALEQKKRLFQLARPLTPRRASVTARNLKNQIPPCSQPPEKPSVQCARAPGEILLAIHYTSLLCTDCVCKARGLETPSSSSHSLEPKGGQQPPITAPYILSFYARHRGRLLAPG